MELLNQMLHRRSVRKYTAEPVTQGQLTAILQAGMLSASGRGLRPWEFVVVTERELLDKLADSRQGGSSRMLAGASAAIVVLGDDRESTTWIEDCSIAMTNMMLMADALGLGGCWIQGRGRMAGDNQTTEDYVRELLNIPQNLRLEAILSLGNTDQHPQPYELDKLPTEKIHWGKY